MLPSIRAPVLSAGIWPETKTLGPAIMAWDCGREGLVGEGVGGERGGVVMESWRELMGGCLRRDGREDVLFVRRALGQVACAERCRRGM